MGWRDRLAAQTASDNAEISPHADCVVSAVCTPPPPIGKQSAQSAQSASGVETAASRDQGPPASPIAGGVVHDIVVLGRPVRVTVWRSCGAINGVELATRDDARRRLVDAIDGRLRAGEGLAEMGLRQAAMADLLRELRRIELGGVGHELA